MVESFFALFAFGALGFWVLCAAAVGFCLWFGDNEWGVATGVLVVVAVLVMWFGYGIDPFAYIVANPLRTVGFIAGYLVVGMIWVAVRWSFFTQDLMDKLRPKIDAFKKGNPGVTQQDVHEYLLRNHPVLYPPQAVENKARIMFWAGYWPVSMAGWLTHRPLYYVSRFIYNRMSGLLNWLSERIIKANL